MARKLAEAIRPHGVELRHAQATRVLATILDENQHTLAAKMKQPQSGTPHLSCSVPGCNDAAHVEVRLFDLYVGHSNDDTELFDQQDFTCPYLCLNHLGKNEEQAQGERRPRGLVRYPYTNKHMAQGYSIYRSLDSTKPS
tara:strand:- start:338 stop:757 length:420 start_codon:yes stop_codon:yes gene_type:complete